MAGNRAGADYGVAGELAEGLYDTVVTSFQFIDIEQDAPLFAGPECSFVGANLWYTNKPFGYCLLLPGAYTALSHDTNGAEMAFCAGSMQDKAYARLFIKVADTQGRSLEEVMIEREAKVE